MGNRGAKEGGAHGDVEALVRSYARRAAEVGAQLLVFPEFLMTPFQVGPEEMARQAQGLQGPFSQMVRSVAAEFGLWVLYTVNERPDCEDEGEVVLEFIGVHFSHAPQRTSA